MRLRFSMRTFVIIVTLLVIGLAGAVASHPLAASGVYTLNWILLCLSVAAAILIRGDQRRFWIGFAVFAWSYWLMGGQKENNNSSSAALQSVTWNVGGDAGVSPALEPARLLSGLLVDYIETHVNPRWSIGDDVIAQYRNGGYYTGQVIDIRPGEFKIRWTDGSSSPDQWTKPGQIKPGTTAVRVAANSFVCSLWGLIGGLLACVLLLNRDAKTQHQQPANQHPLTARPDEIAGSENTEQQKIP